MDGSGLIVSRVESRRKVARAKLIKGFGNSVEQSKDWSEATEGSAQEK